MDIKMSSSANITANRGIPIIIKISLFAYYLVIENAFLKSISLVWWPIIGIIFALFFLRIVSKKIEIQVYLLWVLSFSAIVCTSYFWAEYPVATTKAVIDYLIMIVVVFYISLYIKSEKDIYDIFKIYVFAIFINSLYILFTVPVSEAITHHIGRITLGGSWNANNIGKSWTIAAFMSLLLLRRETQKRFIYLFCIFLFIVIALLTGSRQTLMFIMLSFGMFYGFRKKGKRIRRILIGCIGALIIWNLMLNVGFLYENIGFRFENILGQFNQTDVDYSASLRIEMITKGLQWFIESPLLGYGVGSFAELFGSYSGIYYYSHCNYIELMVGVGIVGTLIYYSSYLFIIRRMNKCKNDLAYFVKIVIVALVILEFSSVTYYLPVFQLLICLGFKVSHFNQSRHRSAL